MKLPKFEDLGTREKIMLAGAGLALAGMMLSLLAVPFVSGVEKMEKDCVRVEKHVVYARSLVASEEAVAVDFQKIESLLGKSLSDAESISDMKGELEGMARDAGLSFDPPSHREPFADSTLPWSEYVVQIAKCEGTMDALVAFLGALESAPAVYRVEKMTVIPSKSGSGITASVVVSRIMLPPEKDQEAEVGES